MLTETILRECDEAALRRAKPRMAEITPDPWDKTIGKPSVYAKYFELFGLCWQARLLPSHLDPPPTVGNRPAQQD
jgi:hypothetical protein